MIALRAFEPGDAPALRTVFESAIHGTAQPFFTRFGFEVVEHRVFELRGVEMRNAAMRKILKGATT